MLRSDPCVHYKMYKAKKNMVYAALFSFAVLGGLSLSQNAKADTVENTNVTPTVQMAAVTSQSATSTQSSAADVNAVNSAPTAQPVSAQPVVNRQDGSASNAASQNQTTTLNFQSAQPAQRFAVTNQASLYTQNLVENDQSQVRNAQLDLSDSTNSSSHSIAHYPGAEWDQNGSFSTQINMANHKIGDIITVGHIVQTSDTNRFAYITTFYDPVIRYHDQAIGVLSLDNSNLQSVAVNLRLTRIPSVTGLIDVTADMPTWLRVNFNNSSAFAGMQTSHNTIQFVNNENQKSNAVAFTIQQPKLQYYDEFKGHEPLRQTSIYNGELYNDGGHIITEIAYPEHDANQVKTTLSDNNVTTPLTVINQTYTFGYDLQSSQAVLPNLDFTAPVIIYNNLPVVNHGRYVNQVNQDYPYAGNGIWAHPAAHREQDGLTMNQLQALIDSNKSEVLYSVQGRNHILLVANLTPEVFRIKESQNELESDYEGSAAVSASDNPQNSAKESAAAEQNVFQMYPDVASVWINYRFADPTVKSTVTLTATNLSNNQTFKVTDTSIVSSSMAHGQAAVKLHVINATNGTELNQWSKLIDEARNKKNSSQ